MENKTMEDITLVKQYQEIKKKHPDALILCRCGDFYETYDEDAKVCASVLGITLTKRVSDGMWMAGFPFHALDTYLPKFIRAGNRVAIVDQLENPKLTKKLEKRGITELVTPGKGFIDVDGAMRHELSREVLDALYRSLDNFIADCTKQEAEEHRVAFQEIKGFIHKRMQEK